MELVGTSPGQVLGVVIGVKEGTSLNLLSLACEGERSDPKTREEFLPLPPGYCRRQRVFAHSSS